jgi:SAM-dependent methyltransferase
VAGRKNWRCCIFRHVLGYVSLDAGFGAWHKDKSMIKRDSAYDQWQSTAQSGELEYHVLRKEQPDEQLEKLNRALFEGFGFKQEDLVGKTVVDIGAGSHLRTRFFQGATIVAVEPLAEEYLDKITWCELKAADVVYPVSAEQRINDLEGTADLVVCINVLDHTYNPGAIVENVEKYLREDGQFLLSVDLHGETNDGMHPVDLTVASIVELLCERGFVIERGYLYLPYRRSYGHGDAATFVMHRQRPGESPKDDVVLQPLRTPRQIVVEDIKRRIGSICRRIKRVFSGESRGIRRLFGGAD